MFEVLLRFLGKGFLILVMYFLTHLVDESLKFVVFDVGPVLICLNVLNRKEGTSR